MARYQTTLTWTQEAMAVVEFEVDDNDSPLRVLEENLKDVQLPNVQHGDIFLVAASPDTTLN